MKKWRKIKYQSLPGWGGEVFLCEYMIPKKCEEKKGEDVKKVLS